MPRDSTSQGLDPLVGTWTTEATHPAMPGVVVHGTTVAEWLEGEKFLILRSRTEHPAFPDAIWILGSTERDRAGAATGSAPTESEQTMTGHYFDSRGVFRVYETRIDAASWQCWRNAAGFSQRFNGRFADGGDTIDGLWQLCEDDVHWNDDVRITYRRRR